MRCPNSAFPSTPTVILIGSFHEQDNAALDTQANMVNDTDPTSVDDFEGMQCPASKSFRTPTSLQELSEVLH